MKVHTDKGDTPVVKISIRLFYAKEDLALLYTSAHIDKEQEEWDKLLLPKQYAVIRDVKKHVREMGENVTLTDEHDERHEAALQMIEKVFPDL